MSAGDREAHAKMKTVHRGGGQAFGSGGRPLAKSAEVARFERAAAAALKKAGGMEKLSVGFALTLERARRRLGASV